MTQGDDALGHQRLRREVNERVAEVNRQFAIGDAHPGSMTILVLCECGDPTCTATQEMTLDEYEAASAEPNQLVVTGKHEIAADAVVSRRNGYVVITDPPDEGALMSWLSANVRRDERSQTQLSSER
jgi:hypothetical protein